MWPDTVKFRSASSEIRGWKEEEKEEEENNDDDDDDETLVKYKSVDNYVGRPKKIVYGSNIDRITVYRVSFARL